MAGLCLKGGISCARCTGELSRVYKDPVSIIHYQSYQFLTNPTVSQVRTRLSLTILMEWIRSRNNTLYLIMIWPVKGGRGVRERSCRSSARDFTTFGLSFADFQNNGTPVVEMLRFQTIAAEPSTCSLRAHIGRPTTTSVSATRGYVTDVRLR